MEYKGIDKNSRTLGIPERPFDEKELDVIAKALQEKLDLPVRRSEAAPKTALIDLFGPPKSLKTAVTVKLDQFFKRKGFKVFCPPETAEIEEIRRKSTDDILIFQAQHVTGVMQNVEHLAYNRDFHLSITSRGAADMLSWYERWVREGKCTEQHRVIVRDYLYREVLSRNNLVDAYFYFYCSPEVAIQREYGESLTEERGSNMNETKLAEAHAVYASVLEHLERNLPGIRIFCIDTTHKTVKQASEEVMRFLLPTLCARFGVECGEVLPYLPALMAEEAKHVTAFEEQLKLKGHPSRSDLEKAGWMYFGGAEQHDTCLDIRTDASGLYDPWGAYGGSATAA